MRGRKKKNNIFALIFARVIVPLMFFAIAFFFWYTWEGTEASSTESNIDFIIRHYNGQGKLIDYHQEIRCNSVNDVKLFVEKNKVQIDYGIITLKWNLSEFVSPEWTEKLMRIGITRYKDEEGRLRVFYYEDEVERWVH